MVSGFDTPAAASPQTRTLFTNRQASEIAALLEELASQTPGVAIGFRPEQHGSSVWVGIVLESRDEEELETASGWLAVRLPGQPRA